MSKPCPLTVRTGAVYGSACAPPLTTRQPADFTQLEAEGEGGTSQKAAASSSSSPRQQTGFIRRRGRTGRFHGRPSRSGPFPSGQLDSSEGDRDVEHVRRPVAKAHQGTVQLHRPADGGNGRSQVVPAGAYPLSPRLGRACARAHGLG